MILFRRKYDLTRIFVLVMSLLAAGSQLLAQEEELDYDEMLQRVDTIENPVYKPVLSVDFGTFNFMGDVRNRSMLPVLGSPAVRVNLTTFIDNMHYFAGNFYFMTGMLSGEQRSLPDLTQQLNFSSSLFAIGASARYEFGHFLAQDKKLRPYVSLGLEQINFSPKGDLFDANDQQYFYWPDGTIRNAPENAPGAALPLVRDYVYETDLRSYERDNYGLGNYNPRSFAIPLEVGFSLKLSQRVFVSMGTSYHYSFSDFLDNVSAEGTHVKGNKGNDGYMFTYLSLHFDMFSDPTTRTVELLYADVELDPIFYDDEDGDFVLDVADRCPGTPFGVVVDTTGCPLDGDGDGVPDYRDKEENTKRGAWVDDEGVTITEEDFLASLARDEAMNRKDVEAYYALIRSRFMEPEEMEIPERFAQLDLDDDGYISFDELLKVIDEYFDFQIDLSLEELRQVNEYFFSQ